MKPLQRARRPPCAIKWRTVPRIDDVRGLLRTRVMVGPVSRRPSFSPLEACSLSLGVDTVMAADGVSTMERVATTSLSMYSVWCRQSASRFTIRPRHQHTALRNNTKTTKNEISKPTPQLGISTSTSLVVRLSMPMPEKAWCSPRRARCSIMADPGSLVSKEEQK